MNDFEVMDTVLLSDLEVEVLKKVLRRDSSPVLAGDDESFESKTYPDFAVDITEYETMRVMGFDELVESYGILWGFTPRSQIITDSFARSDEQLSVQYGLLLKYLRDSAVNYVIVCNGMSPQFENMISVNASHYFVSEGNPRVNLQLYSAVGNSLFEIGL